MKSVSKVIKDSHLVYLTFIKRNAISHGRSKPENILAKVNHTDIHALTIKGSRFLNVEYISVLKSTGPRVFVWMINRRECAAYYEMIGVDGIFTDAIVAMKKIVYVGDVYL
ncbi:MAG: hypothetical protein AB8B89_01975 [Gammaproteobacteria bacterium]